MPVSNGPTSAEIKPPRGKLLRCTITIQAGVIVDATFTGDFFMMPGEAIQQLEQRIVGCRADITSFGPAIQDFFTAEIELMGATSDDFVTVVAKAIGIH
jgi:hypothetical protein